MSVTKLKTSVSKKKLRISHHKLSSVNVTEDKKSGNINFLIILILNLGTITERKF